MSALGKRLEKLEISSSNGVRLLLLDPKEGETEDEAKARISAGVPSDAPIVWLSWTDAEL